MSFATTLALVGIVVVVLTTTTKINSHPLPSTVFAAAIALIGVVALTVSAALERPLDCSSDERLAASYRTRFFLRVAFAQLVALLGFVGFILTNTAWLYGLGVAFTMFGYYRLAPTSSHLATDERILQVGGCDRSLVRALAVTPPASEPGR